MKSAKFVGEASIVQVVIRMNETELPSGLHLLIRKTLRLLEKP